MKIEINIAQKVDSYYLYPIYNYLKLLELTHNFTVELTTKGKYGQIFIDGKYKAYLDYADRATLMSPTEPDDITIFKYQYHPDHKYKKNVISAGYIGQIGTDITDIDFYKNQHSRDIDVMARMRTHQEHSDRKSQDWSIARKTVVDIAQKLGNEGLITKINKIQINRYKDELWKSKIAYNWRGIGCLNFKIIEYLQTGVVMLSDDLSRFPIREDVYLEHEKTAFFCETPKMFYNETKMLLKDPAKIKKISNNCIELWQEKLSPIKHGEWYYEKLKQLNNQ